MNKKTQFFLIAAVVVCLSIFSVSKVSYPPPSPEKENFYALYTSIKNACVDTVKYSTNATEDLATLEKELEELCREESVNIVLDWEIEGTSIDFYLKLFNSEIMIEDPFTILLSSSKTVKVEDLLLDKIIVKGDVVDNEDFYRYEKLYRYEDKFIKSDKSGSEFRVEGYYKEIIPKIGSFSPLPLQYTPYEVVDGSIEKYDFVIVNDISGVDYEKVHQLYEYLKNGGNLLFLGRSGRTFVELLNEEGIRVLNMTKHDFYVDNTKLVMVGKGTGFLRRGTRNVIVYGSTSFEDGEKISTGTVFFSAIEEGYEETLINILFTIFKEKEQRGIDVNADGDLIVTASNCRGLTLEINSEPFTLTSSQYTRHLPMEKGSYRIVLRGEDTIYEIIVIQVY